MKKFILFFLVFTSLLFSQSVYITKTGKKYHSAGCSYLSKSRIEISLKDAIARGYSACSRCKPPSIFSNYIPLHYDNEALISFLPAFSKSEQVVYHYAYCLLYDEDNEQAKWVAYLNIKNNSNIKVKRINKFLMDPLIKTGSADDYDYKGSGFDRGHLCPAADMSFSTIAMRESFYYSNISPQVPSFNRGIWKNLEDRVRQWLLYIDTLYIIAGPVLEPGLKKIGHNEVSIPQKYFKIILSFNNNVYKSISFIIPNRKCSDGLFNYAVSIDKVEEVTGIDFFPSLPDDIENIIESKINLDLVK